MTLHGLNKTSQQSQAFSKVPAVSCKNTMQGYAKRNHSCPRKTLGQYGSLHQVLFRRTCGRQSFQWFLGSFLQSLWHRSHRERFLLGKRKKTQGFLDVALNLTEYSPHEFIYFWSPGKPEKLSWARHGYPQFLDNCCCWIINESMAPTVGPLLNWTKTVVSNSYPSKSLSVQCLGLPWPFGHPMDVGNRKQNHLGAVTTNQKGA